MRRRVLPLAVASLVLSGCGGGGPAGSTSASEAGADGATSASAQSSQPTTSDPATAAGSPTGSTSGPGRITLAFAGDVHFERQVAPLLQDSDGEWRDRLPELAAADFAMVNLETAITERGTRANKTYTFRTSPVALSKLEAAGVDAVSMANNHAADFGRQGVEDTLAAKAASPIPIVGFGKDEAEAYAPLSVDVKGVKVGVISSMQVHEETYANWSAGPDSPGVAQNIRRDRFTQAARDAVASHDLVVAFLHWGSEGSTCPNGDQAETVRILEEAGVDVIVGTHAHRPQGSGWSGRAFVGYGTGNFVWYNTSAASRSSGVLTVTVDAEAARNRGRQDASSRAEGPPLVTTYSWAPKLISYGGVPETPTESMPRLKRAAAAATQCSGLAQSPG